MDTENQTQVFWKSRKCFWPLSHFFRHLFREVGLLDHLVFLFLFTYFRCWCSDSGPVYSVLSKYTLKATILCHWAVSVALGFFLFFCTGHQILVIACARQVLYHWAISLASGLPFLSKGLAIYLVLALKYVTLPGLLTWSPLATQPPEPWDCRFMLTCQVIFHFFEELQTAFYNDYISLHFHWQ